MLVPLRATVELEVNPVPIRFTIAAVLIGPALGESEVSVGAGGLVIETVSALEVEGVAVASLTVMVAVPEVVSRFAGNVAVMNSDPYPVLPHCWAVSAVPFHSSENDEETTGKLGDETRLEPYTVMVVAPEPTINCAGYTWVITGVEDCGSTSSHAPMTVPPPGVGFKTLTKYC